MEKILVVEDEEPISDLIELNLSMAGYEITQAFDGEEGLRYINNENFDLILLDILLPKIDGYELMKHAVSKKTPVIFLTAKTSLKDKVFGLNSGADDYITKPFEGSELVARVKSVLRRAGKEEKLKTIGDIQIFYDSRKVFESEDAIVIEQPYSKFIFRTLLSPKNELSIVRKPFIYYQLYQPDKLTSLPVYDPNFGFDLRSSDLTGLDLRDRFNELIHADFDNQTKWPDKLPEGFNPESIMELGKNPGLGLRNITQKGITGKNIGIAIIDASLLVDHVEYKDRLKLYEEIHCNDTQAQMHGPAVASIAAGKNVGVAPEADLYYIADTAGTINGQKFEYDLSWTAKSIERIVQINKTLPKDKKIRVISISLGINPSMKNYDKAIESIKKAEKDGIYTVYVGSEAFFGLGRDPLKNPDDITSFSKGIFWNNDQYDNCWLLIPMDSRSTASPTGTNDYVFYRTGGMSWSVPYVAGLYALACQVNPNITPDVFWKEAFRTSDTIQVDNNGSKDLLGKIVNPQKLIGSIKNLK